MSNGPSSPTGSGSGDDLSRPRSWASQDRSPAQNEARRALEQAQARERELRARLAELVIERRRLWQESQRLRGLGERSAADHRLDDVAARYRARVEQLGRELESVRSELRAQEAVVAERKADADGV